MFVVVFPLISLDDTISKYTQPVLADTFLYHNSTAFNFIDSQIGSQTNVLVESVEDELCSGLSENYLKINFEGNSKMLNQIVNVSIISNSNGNILGEASLN